MSEDIYYVGGQPTCWFICLNGVPVSGRFWYRNDAQAWVFSGRIPEMWRGGKS